MGKTTKADNEDGAEVNIQLNKTIKEIIGDIADSKIKDVVNNIKTGDTIAISVLVLAVAGIAIVVTIVKKNKSSKEDSKF